MEETCTRFSVADCFDKPIISPLFDLRNQPYWKRLWIIQEIVRAYQGSTVLCGKYEWPLYFGLLNKASSCIHEQEFVSLTSAGSQGRPKRVPSTNVRDAYDCFGSIQRLQQISESYHEGNGDAGLFKFLHVARHAQQTVIRNKIYVTLGLISRKIVDSVCYHSKIHHSSI